MAGTYAYGFDYESELAKSKLLENQLRGSQSMQMPQVGSGASSDVYSQFSSSPSLGGAQYSSKIAKQGQQGMDAANAASLGASAAGGAMAGGPVGAGIAVGGQLLAQYMANKAQAEQAKRQRDIEIAQQHSAGERQGIDQMLSAWRGALR